MKTAKKLFLFLMLASAVWAQSNLPIEAKYSLFHEFIKNNDFTSAYKYGWEVVSENPAPFVKFNIFRRMENMMWAYHDSLAQSDEEKTNYADSTILLYDIALKFDESNKSYYMLKKAFVLEEWKQQEGTELIPMYEQALELDPNADAFYFDRLGQLYSKNAEADPEAKVKALELYGKLSEREPDNALWPERQQKLTSNPEELADILKKSWDLNPDNTEKAWKYANICMRSKFYERALEPLEFLVKANPDVPNYWKNLSVVYTQLDKDTEAMNALKKLSELDPNSKESFAGIAVLYQKQNQLTNSRTYINKAMAIDPDWDYPLYLEGQLYESAVRNCGGKIEFIDKCVYQLAYETYSRARSKNGQYAQASAERMGSIRSLIPQQEDYFFRNIKPGTAVKIQGKCYDWIGKTITVQ